MIGFKTKGSSFRNYTEPHGEGQNWKKDGSFHPWGKGLKGVTMRVIFSVFILAIIIGANIIEANDRMNKMNNPPIAGGRCEYKEYPGYAKITSITKINIPGEPNERYEVKFMFYPYQEVEEGHAQVEGKEFLLLLTNSSYPGPKFLKKYGIKVGKVFDCYLKVIVRGTCTPILFEFPSIRLDDYCDGLS